MKTPFSLSHFDSTTDHLFFNPSSCVSVVSASVPAASDLPACAPPDSGPLPVSVLPACALPSVPEPCEPAAPASVPPTFGSLSVSEPFWSWLGFEVSESFLSWFGVETLPASGSLPDSAFPACPGVSLPVAPPAELPLTLGLSLWIGSVGFAASPGFLPSPLVGSVGFVVPPGCASLPGFSLGSLTSAIKSLSFSPSLTTIFVTLYVLPSFSDEKSTVPSSFTFVLIVFDALFSVKVTVTSWPLTSSNLALNSFVCSAFKSYSNFESLATTTWFPSFPFLGVSFCFFLFCVTTTAAVVTLATANTDSVLANIIFCFCHIKLLNIS
ncbi:Uncharacterised protein [Mycoplasmopsis bovigenitalium]|uniref:Uncharacterized protein n=1 Tax=Mycoplasmopsis bovigenitalium TaxID=2112 RepID=A0A449A9H2_9BACT|nr:hypothetical protein [Mycoplasmopsis bovigenitalium]VEU60871.1 Uncharacterised protein [Mycoplasmopsis bovigenitalium]